MSGRRGRLVDQVRYVGWFLRDAAVTAPRPTFVAVASELGSFGCQVVAFGLLVKALADPSSLLQSLSTTQAAIVLTGSVLFLLLSAEVLKFVGQSAKYRIGFVYEVSALRRTFRYAHRGNRFNRLTVKDLVSRSPQVSARVAMAVVDGVVPAVVLVLSAAAIGITHPIFTIWLAIALVGSAPAYFLVLRRGRQATERFYSPAGLNYARDAVLFFSPGRGGVHARGVLGIPREAEPSLRALEVRRSTPNLTYLVTGSMSSLTLAGLVGYAVLLASSNVNPSQDLLQIFFILRFVYQGVGGVSGAMSKCQILLPRVEPVIWALKGDSPPRPHAPDLVAPSATDIEDELDEA